MNINPFGKKPLTVEGILSSFKQAISDLDTFAGMKADEASTLESEADEMRRVALQQEADAEIARAEITRALGVRKKLESLISHD